MNCAATLSRSPDCWRARLLRCRHGAGMIVNNPPAFRKALENERKDATDVALRARQMPMAQHQRGVRAQKTEFESGEIQMAHGRAIRIIFLVARQDRVPAARDSASSGKGQVRRVPVAFKKRIDVAPVPGALLRLQNLCDGRAIALALIGGAEFRRMYGRGNKS